MTIPYCGLPPVPGQLLGRWNLDPILLAALAGLAFAHLRKLDGGPRSLAAAGWGVAALAFVSPLCALSIALFSARVGQHMILMLIAAPLIGGALPAGCNRWSMALSAATFSLALWVWHMPVPYAATFGSTIIYWTMHATLFGSAIWLWREILTARAADAGLSVIAGTFVSMQMGLLGAVLALSSHPLFAWHLTTTQAWGLTPLEDQQLGGTLMWVPGIVIFLWAALRSMWLLRAILDRPAAQ